MYHTNGQKHLVRYWENGEQNGTETWWYDNGVIDIVINYKNDILDGEYLSYTPDGSIIKKCFYVQNDKHGKEYFYFDNGLIEDEFNYVNDKKDGEQLYYKMFDEGHFLVNKEKYENGMFRTMEYARYSKLDKGKMFICDNRLYKVSRGNIKKSGLYSCTKSNNFQVVRLKWQLNTTHVVPDDDHSKSIHYIDHFL